MDAKFDSISLDDNMRRRLERLRSGCVLLAQEGLKDPNFEGTVVLICVHGEDGAYGVVMNHASHMPLSEMFDGFSGMARMKKVHIGGPVRQDELQILQLTDQPAENAYQVAPRVYLGGQWEDLQRVIDADETTSYLFLGYSGWAAGQLEYEVIAGAWEVYNVELERFLNTPEEHWTGTPDELAQRLERMQTTD
jgi:putative transcriptional regulator